jgi:hypothetical protein
MWVEPMAPPASWIPIVTRRPPACAKQKTFHGKVVKECSYENRKKWVGWDRWDLGLRVLLRGASLTSTHTASITEWPKAEKL